MKLAILDIDFVADETALKALSGMSDQRLVLRSDNSQAYMYFASSSTKNVQGAILPDDGVTNTGAWLKDAARPVYAVADNYDFGANGATELDFQTNVSKRWILGSYLVTANDINQIADVIGWQRTSVITESNLESPLSPYITSVENGVLAPSISQTITVNGNYFEATTKITIPGLKGTIDDVRILSSIRIEIDVTAAANETTGSLSIVAYNKASASTDWPNDAGQGAITVAVIPTGQELYLRDSGASGTNYDGTPFAKSEWASIYGPDNCFDNNNGTRHYSGQNQGDDHYVGIIMSLPTLLTQIGGRFTDDSNPFRLEGSNDTTDGDDGTWTDLGDYTITNAMQNVSGDPVYKAYRIVWTNAESNFYVGVRELYFLGRQ